MKRIIAISLTLAIVTAWIGLFSISKHVVSVAHAQSGCSNASLTGIYGAGWQGFDILKAGTRSVPWAGVGLLTADGAGDMTIVFTSALNGTISAGATGAGTYTVNPDCTGSASFTSGDAAGETFSFVIVGGGTEMLSVSTLDTQTIMLDAKKQ